LNLWNFICSAPKISTLFLILCIVCLLQNASGACVYEKVKAHPYSLPMVSTSTLPKIVADTGECCTDIHVCAKLSEPNIWTSLHHVMHSCQTGVLCCSWI
jgi:hypothetical protein